MSDLCTTHNDLVDVCMKNEDELQLIRLKLVDLEVRSRWNNIKFLNQGSVAGHGARWMPNPTASLSLGTLSGS